MELEPTMSVLKTILTRFPVSLAVLVIMWALHLVDFPTSHWLALTTAHPGGAIICPCSSCSGSFPLNGA